MSDEMRLQAYLDGHPDDVEARLVLADLLEEQGREEAAALQRWLARNRRWPDSDLAFCQIDGWHWWATVSPEHNHRAHALIPDEVQKWMPDGEWLYFRRQEAEAVLAEALVRGGVLRVVVPL